MGKRRVGVVGGHNVFPFHSAHFESVGPSKPHIGPAYSQRKRSQISPGMRILHGFAVG
jgi:hypothetical protein